MNKQQAAAEIIHHALPIVPFEGWNMPALQQAAVEAGYSKADVIRVFPGGAIEAADLFSRLSDAQMLETLQAHPLQEMKVRERIATAVKLRIGAQITHREAVRKTVALHALPIYALHGLRCLYDTVNAIWYAAGDTATDFNFYTKRLMLAGVYSSTLLYWLDDKSPDQENSWAFLERRIADVMKIEKAKGTLFKRRA